MLCAGQQPHTEWIPAYSINNAECLWGMGKVATSEPKDGLKP